jgi:hypothetical protein
MAEFLGSASDPGREGHAFLKVGDERHINYLDSRQASELASCLNHDFEIFRSLWDSVFLLVDLDIEYVNFDFPAEPYLDPPRTFALQQGVSAAVEKHLLGFGISPLHLLSGRGHHFIWQLRRDSKLEFVHFQAT